MRSSTGSLRLRWKAASAGWSLWLRARTRSRACRSLGKVLDADGSRLGAADGEGHAALSALEASRASLAALGPRLDESLARDRREYGEVSAALRALVIGRGLFDRALVRGRMRAIDRERSRIRELLGALYLEGRVTTGEYPAPDQHVLDEARRAAQAYASLATDRARWTSELGGRVYPRWAEVLGREVAGFGQAMAKELKTRWLPKTSGLVGMGVGWVVARIFTASPLANALDRFGLYRGDAQVVSRDTYESLQFWLPLVAGVACSYIGTRIGRAVREHYQPSPSSQAEPESPTIRAVTVHARTGSNRDR